TISLTAIWKSINVRPTSTMIFSKILLPPPRSPLFPYTTLFRSQMRSATFGLRLWGIADEPFIPRSNGSSTSPTSVREVEEPFDRSEEHTSELQSRGHLVCRLLLEKKKQLQRSIRHPRYNHTVHC